MFEHHKQPLISRKEFFARSVKYAAFAFVLVIVSWLIGILGYHGFEHLPWLDSVLNAAMILGGMGPVNSLQTEAGKIFASLYALFSGIVFLVAVGVLAAPTLHRIMHKFHLRSEGE